jgi:hypothetical protein
MVEIRDREGALQQLEGKLSELTGYLVTATSGVSPEVMPSAELV